MCVLPHTQTHWHNHKFHLKSSTIVNEEETQTYSMFALQIGTMLFRAPFHLMRPCWGKCNVRYTKKYESTRCRSHPSHRVGCCVLCLLTTSARWFITYIFFIVCVPAWLLSLLNIANERIIITCMLNVCVWYGRMCVECSCLAGY